MAGLYAPLPTLRRHPRGGRRTARGRCGLLVLHRSGLAPPTPCRFLPAHTRNQEFLIFRKLGSKGFSPHERGFESGSSPAEDFVNARKGNQRASVSIDDQGEPKFGS